VTLLLYPLAAMTGGLVGTIAHESLHALAAVTLGQLVGVGWVGGLAGGPVVDYRAPTRVRDEIIRKLPLAAGVVVAVVVALGSGVTPGRVALGGVAAGLLWSSPADLWAARARVPNERA